MNKQILEERDRIVKRGVPEEACAFIVAHGGDQPPSDTNWDAVFEAGRKSLVSMESFDEQYTYDVLSARDMAVAGDLLFPRYVLEASLARINGHEVRGQITEVLQRVKYVKLGGDLNPLTEQIIALVEADVARRLLTASFHRDVNEALQGVVADGWLKQVLAAGLEHIGIEPREDGVK